VTTSLADAVDYATQNAPRRRRDAKKPIKNSGLAGSANTCIGITRQTAFTPGRIPAYDGTTHV
jgi:hypothetical protein